MRWADSIVRLGGDAPVVVQSMTNTDTADAIATAIQVKELAQAGSEVVRITVNYAGSRGRGAPRSARSSTGWACAVPLIGDFHYNGHKLLTQYPAVRRRRCPSTASIRATSAAARKRERQLRAR